MELRKRYVAYALPAALLVFVTLVVVLGWGRSSAPDANASSFGTARMDLVIAGGTGTCSTAGITDFSTPPKCTLNPSQTFDLDIVFTNIPSPGWEGWQTKILHGNLTYNPTVSPTAEFKAAALLPLRSFVPGVISHGDVTGFFAPFPDNTSKGVMLNLSFTCNQSETLSLPGRGDAHPDGANMATNDNTVNNVPPDVSIQVNCGAPTAIPTTPAPTNTPTNTFTPTPTCIPGKVPIVPGGGCGTPTPTPLCDPPKVPTGVGQECGTPTPTCIPGKVHIEPGTPGLCGTATPTATPTPLQPDLIVSKSHSPASPVGTKPMAYTIEIRNQGGGGANGVVLRDTLPANFTFSSAVSLRGADCDHTGGSPGGTVDCDIGTLGIGFAAFDIVVIEGTVNTTVGKEVTNTAEADPDDTVTESDETNNTDEDTVNIVAPTATPTPTFTPTFTAVPTATPVSATDTPTSSPTPVATATPVPTATPLPTETPTPSDTPVPSSTPTPSQTPLPSNTPTITQTPTLTVTPTPPGESVNEEVAAGGKVTTDTEGDGATPNDPIETSVTIPIAGKVTITEKNTTSPNPAGFTLLPYQVNILAPPASAQTPIIIVFQIDPSILPAGTDEQNIQIFRSGQLVPPCANSALDKADPDPCVQKRNELVGAQAGDIQLRILSSAPSSWNFGVAGPTPTPTVGLQLGDVDGNGDVNSLDALWILLVLSAILPDMPHPQVADVNLDGVIDPTDALLILQLDADLIPSLPPPTSGAGAPAYDWYFFNNRPF